MYWIAFGTLALSLFASIAVIARWAGGVEQTQKGHGLKLAEYRDHHDTHYKQAKEHEANDNKHFSDTDMHWNRRERDWLNTRFEEMGEQFKDQTREFGRRFDDVERMISSLRQK